MLHVSLLGEQAITEDGTGIQARSSRAIALVAFLVAHAGAPQSRQHIAGVFWPDSTDAQALTNLSRELHHLRQILGDERSLVVTGQGSVLARHRHVPGRPARLRYRAAGGPDGRRGRR